MAEGGRVNYTMPPSLVDDVLAYARQPRPLWNRRFFVRPAKFSERLRYWLNHVINGVKIDRQITRLVFHKAGK